MHKVRRFAVLTSALILAIAVAGCSSPPQAGTPEAAVQDLLTLRSQLTTDSAKYASYVETSLADALAQDSQTATRTPIPEWKTPKRTEETSSSAKVTVRWKASKDFGDWADATIFVLERRGERWIVVDARDAAGSTDATSTP